MQLTALKGFFINNRFLVLLSIFIIFLLAFNIFGYLYLRKLKETKPQLTPPLVSPTPSFTSPVKNEYLGTIPKYAQEADHLVLFLPEPLPVYALFTGKISYVGQKMAGEKIEFENLVIVNEKENLSASYLLAPGSEVLVEEGDSVTEGEEIAKTSQEIGPGCLGGANLGVYLFKDGQPVKLTKEMMKTGKTLP